MFAPYYAIASNLIGFKHDTLRVKVIRCDGDYLFVWTADLCDAGTFLCLDASQVSAPLPN